MKLRLAPVLGFVLVPAVAHAGGLFLPGNGAVSTSRAGAAVASASDGEALSINPAGLAKSKGTTITLSAAIINYAMSFTRRGTYDPIDTDALPYEGQPFPTVRNDASPPLGIGGYQPIPVIAVVTDLGGAVKGLTLAAGVYAPNSYPFRDMCTELSSGCRKYAFNGDFNVAPPPQRYDIVSQEAAVFVPTIAAAYRISPQLDVGARVGWGIGEVKSKIALWGTLDNYIENVKEDVLFGVEGKDNFVPSFGVGVTFRPTPVVELGLNYSSQMSLLAKGDATSELGPEALLNTFPIVVRPVADEEARCAPGGTADLQKACVELALPMSVTLGGRYKFIGNDGAEKGDVELNATWENWSAERANNYRVVVDGDIYLVDASGNENFAAPIVDNYVKHGFQDSFGVRLGGSYRIPAGNAEVIVRGGVAYDTQTAKDGWLRADVDGAARTTGALGIGYRAKRFEINVGFGYVYEGTNENPGTCNPDTNAMPPVQGCGSGGIEQPVDDRTGPDPISPVLIETAQAENPVTQGTYDSSYTMFLLGFSTWF
ncbi:MAG: OmpP1/FadL family transporter [Kofleriaceae bacterium]